MAADADDSMAATTIQMLNMGLQKAWVPAPQRSAAAQAIAASQRLLASLRNPQSQLYRVFPGTELYYLMDNIEVYEALRSDIHAAGPANQLAAAIRKQFWTGQQWKPAIPEYAQAQFYPHTLASGYLLQMSESRVPASHPVPIVTPQSNLSLRRSMVPTPRIRSAWLSCVLRPDPPMARLHLCK